MPAHIRFLLVHAAIGFAISCVFTGLLLWLNIGNLWHLVTHSPDGPVAVLMLIVFGTITFGSAQIGYRIMTLGEDKPKGSGGARPRMPTSSEAAPAPVRVRH